ncbi:MAG TPA: hypothetical protein VH120_05275 [Gemmataceae bacterium]|nr:hypothetical protein [Gemmataceae bacterium]
MLRTVVMVLSACAVGLAPPPEPTGPDSHAERFTEEDSVRAKGRVVKFTGRVIGQDGLEELHRLVLKGETSGPRQWQALVTPDTWHRFDVGDEITIVGTLTLHEAVELTFATIREQK